jgi:sugar fermentation stimulation protein A
VPGSKPQRYRWIQHPEEATFLERLNRFSCLVEMKGSPTRVYLPNSGRLEELLRPGASVLVERRRSEGKTHHDLLLVRTPCYPHGKPIWVCTDSRLPPKLLGWAIQEGYWEEFGVPQKIQYEPQVEHGRFDLRVESELGLYLVETKSVNLLDRRGVARFPDAPTARGTRHLQSLAAQKPEHGGSWIVFVVMREDATAFSPLPERDPDFALTLSQARAAGVGVQALHFAAGPEMEYKGQLNLLLPAHPFPGVWPPDTN